MEPIRELSLSNGEVQVKSREVAFLDAKGWDRGGS